MINYLIISQLPEFRALSNIRRGVEHLAFWTWLKCVNTKNSLGQEFLKLGVWRRHAGLKDWKLAVARFAIQLLSKPLCQLCDKQKLNSRLDMPQNTEEQQARRRQRDVHTHWINTNKPYQILGQEASMLPAGHLPTMCMDANHAPLTSWRMSPVVYSKLL